MRPTSAAVRPGVAGQVIISGVPGGWSPSSRVSLGDGLAAGGGEHGRSRPGRRRARSAPPAGGRPGRPWPCRRRSPAAGRSPSRSPGCCRGSSRPGAPPACPSSGGGRAGRAAGPRGGRPGPARPATGERLARGRRSARRCTLVHGLGRRSTVTLGRSPVATRVRNCTRRASARADRADAQHQRNRERGQDDRRVAQEASPGPHVEAHQSMLRVDGRMKRLRASSAASLAAVLRLGPGLATLAWAAGCATPPDDRTGVRRRAPTPPPASPSCPRRCSWCTTSTGTTTRRSPAQLGQAVTQQTVALMADELRRRGYDVNLQARWDGIYDGNGQLLVGGNELAWLASSIVQFANSEAGGGEGPMESAGVHRAGAGAPGRLGHPVGRAAVREHEGGGGQQRQAHRPDRRGGVLRGGDRGDHRPADRAEQGGRRQEQRRAGRGRRAGGRAVPMGAGAGVGAASAVASGPGAPTTRARSARRWGGAATGARGRRARLPVVARGCRPASAWGWAGMIARSAATSTPTRARWSTRTSCSPATRSGCR